MKAMSRSRYDRYIRNAEITLLATLLPEPQAMLEPMPEPTIERFPRTGKTWTLTLADVARAQQLHSLTETAHGQGGGSRLGWTAKLDQKRSRMMRRKPAKHTAKPKAQDHRLHTVDKTEAEAKAAMAEGIQWFLSWGVE